MLQIYARLSGRSGPFVLTPHGLYRLSDPQAVRPGRLHRNTYHPFGLWAWIVDVLPDPGLSCLPSSPYERNPQS